VLPPTLENKLSRQVCRFFSSNLYLGYTGQGSRFLTMEVKKLNKNSRIGFMVFNSTLNNISAISWLAVLLVEETSA